MPEKTTKISKILETPENQEIKIKLKMLTTDRGEDIMRANKRKA